MGKVDFEAQLSAAIASVRDERDADIFWYNGTIGRGADLSFMNCVKEYRSRNNAAFLLTTSGGSPDAAYKMSRYLQDHYEHIELLVSGTCKSAGTLFAIGADVVAFSPYGELGPLDIQTYKTDNLGEMQSGLVTFDSLDTLTFSAIRAHGMFFSAITEETGHVISVKTAAETAAQLITGIYAPIMARIDPSEVGEKARLMQIAEYYGKRLNLRPQNLKQGALAKLVETYPSHSFVIDLHEAQTLFERVRSMTEAEMTLVEVIGDMARHETRETAKSPKFGTLTEGKIDGGNNDAPKRGRNRASNGKANRRARRGSNGPSDAGDRAEDAQD